MQAVFDASSDDDPNSTDNHSFDSPNPDFVPQRHDVNKLLPPYRQPPLLDQRSLWAAAAPPPSPSELSLSLSLTPLTPSPTYPPLLPYPSPICFSPDTPSKSPDPSPIPFPPSLSPILPSSPNPLPPLLTDSYLLNFDNTFAMPLVILNNTYVFNPFPN